MSKAKPTKTITCGQITAAIWPNSKVVNDRMVELPTVTIDKAYKQGNDWKHTQSFSVEDLPKVAIVAEEVYRQLRLTERTPSGE